MHGIIFVELKKYVHAGFGAAAWERVCREAGVKRAGSLATQTYPDAELVALLGAASRVSGIAVPDLLIGFGEFIVPDLVKVYGAFVDKSWTALDLLENTESVIHRAVRLQDPNAAPPRLRIERPGPTQVVIRYSSPRRLCAVAKGIIRGVGQHYGETLTVEETSCMHEGAQECTLVVTRQPAPAAAPAG
ncbi:MAG: heme NO-binding domain-containing protein [Gemmatimonadaceae bacterium]